MISSPDDVPLRDLDLGTRYEPLRELGRGGAGRVLLVRDAHLGQEVALKLLHSEAIAPQGIEEMQREFALLSRIEHAGIARAHDFGYLRGRPFFTSEFIRGETLGRSGPDGMDLAGFLSLSARLGEAVAFLHRSGLLHLDIKPGNIIACTEPGRARPVLIDFGLCRGQFETARRDEVRGSLPYMAPEYETRETLGPWTDVYALGVTLYRLLTGRFPRPGLASAGPLEEPWLPAPPRPSSFAPWVSEDVDAAILRCLALAPRSRFGSAAELQDALLSIGTRGANGGGPSRAVKPPGSGAPPMKTVGREAELALVDRFIESRARGTAGNEPAILILSGAPGMGQTHLLGEIKVRSQIRGLPFVLETGYPGSRMASGSLFGFLSSSLGGAARSRWVKFLSLLRSPRARPRHDALDAERRLRWATELSKAVSSIRDPLILAVDGLQHFDEVSISLLLDLAGILAAGDGAERSRVGIVAGYREEGPAEPLLRSLTGLALESRRALLLALRPLDIQETFELHRLVSGEAGSAGAHKGLGLALFQETGGVPARIASRATRKSAATSREGGSAGERCLDLPEPPGRVLRILEFLGRPARFPEVLRLSGLARRGLESSLEELRRRGLAALEGGPSREARWFATRAASTLTRMPSMEEKRLHLKIARDLHRRSRSQPGPQLVEALRHYRGAGRSGRYLRLALHAARYLRSTAQTRAALRLLEEVLDAMPADQAALKVEISLEAAELEARLGRIDEGIRLAGSVTRTARKLQQPWPARAVLGLAALHGRRGDFQRAEALFAEGFRIVGRRKDRLPRDEHLAFLNEQAATKAFLGKHEEALAICEAGLKSAGRSRAARVREAALNFHATKGTVALRGFRFEDAAQRFETALSIAEAIGSTANRAVILNNLGIVHSQSDRPAEALRRFREAERQALDLDEGPSLSFIHGNVAVLLSKTGDFEGMERSLRAADEVASGARTAVRSGGEEARLGRREAMFLAHHRGLALLHRGHPTRARPAFEAAIAIATDTGDSILAAIDRTYRAECLLFDGAFGEAEGELRSLARSAPTRVARMASSRLALLASWTGALEPERGAPATGGSEPSVPALDAWDDLFLAWALSLAKSEAAYGDCLSRARRYFESRGLGPAASLAAWIEAEAAFLRGDRATALEAASRAAGQAGASDLVKASCRILEARIALDGPGEASARAADLLAEGGALLEGMKVPEWRLRLDCVRAAVSTSGSSSRRAALADVERRRKTLAEEIPPERRAAYQEAWHWRKWSDCLRGGTGPRGAARSAASSAPSKGRRSATDPITHTVELRSMTRECLRGRIVAASPAMRRLVVALDRLRGSDLPGVIQGETGSGKEMAARLIHAQSKRYCGPFLVIDLRAIPAHLVEVELFGARAGAFTDLARDRPGLLAAASGGTVLIDEIGESGPELQAKLLRVLASGAARAVGSTEETPIDVRFLFTTTRSLDEETRAGRLRPDLLYRIRVVSIEVPPLRERADDIPGLVELFYREGEEPMPEIDDEVLSRLKALPWPGNARELRNLVARWRMEGHRRITGAILDRALPSTAPAALFPSSLLTNESLPVLQESLEREYLRHHFRRFGGDAAMLARSLGVSRKHLYRRLKQLGISVREMAKGEG